MPLRPADDREGVIQSVAAPSPTEVRFRALVVAKILDMKPEEAIEMLSKHYRIQRPRIGIGVLEGRTKTVRAVYSQGRKEILVAKMEYFYDPFVLIHEFYHHLRSVSGKHRGTERQANEFAIDFIMAYNESARLPDLGPAQDGH
ncbi:MAG TPA: hypothetical protein VLY21_03650 [Nitrososphaerales archaeon]|nr:hypothetical protein [Nitrososphaerales archaeon]